MGVKRTSTRLAPSHSILNLHLPAEPRQVLASRLLRRLRLHNVLRLQANLPLGVMPVNDHATTLPINCCLRSQMLRFFGLTQIISPPLPDPFPRNRRTNAEHPFHVSPTRHFYLHPPTTATNSEMTATTMNSRSEHAYAAPPPVTSECI